MSIHVKYGDKLYLSCQLHDRNTTRRVFVDLRKTDGSLVTARFEIPHVAFGVFKEATKTMPAEDSITAHYIVFEADGVTYSTSYTTEQEVYMRDLTGEIVDLNLDRSISSIVDTNLAGTIASNEIDAEITSVSISGSLNTLELEGVIDG